MQVDISFLSRKRYPGHLDFMIFLAALAIFAGTAWCVYDRYRVATDLEYILLASRKPMEKHTFSISAKHIGEINTVIMQLNLPWSEFLSSIERNLSNNVALLGIEPNAETHTVRIEGEAKTAEDMIEFAEQLGHDSFFSAATLLRHQINDSDRNRPYRFAIEAAWR